MVTERNIIVFDLDSTLRDTRQSDHMVPYDMSRTEHWLPWQKHVVEYGEPIPGVTNLYRALHDVGLPVYIVTGSQGGTLQWLDKHDIPLPDKIVERDMTEHAAPFEYKRKWLSQNAERILTWIDDDVRVSKFVRDTIPETAVMTVVPPVRPSRIMIMRGETFTITKQTKFAIYDDGTITLIRHGPNGDLRFPAGIRVTRPIQNQIENMEKCWDRTVVFPETSSVRGIFSLVNI